MGEAERSERKTWIGRAVAICTGVAAITGALALFLSNVGQIMKPFARTPAALEIRDVRVIGPSVVVIPFTDIEPFRAIAIDFVVDKKGDKELRNCVGELYWNGEIQETAQPQTFDFESGTHVTRHKVGFVFKGENTEADFRLACEGYSAAFVPAKVGKFQKEAK